MRIGRIKVLTLFWLIYFKTFLTHNLDKCPPPWQWKLRAKAFCNTSPEKYSCLYDVIQKIYKESCSWKPDYVKPGKRYVVRGERDNDNCRDSRYQPFKLWSNRSSECEFIKNECNEMGQVIVSNGSTTKDRTCRCDYIKGFDFVIKPINVCYCIPSEEECSCYQKTCSSDELLSKDYVCDSKVNQDVKDGTCFPIVGIRNTSFGSSPTSRPTPSLADSDKYMEAHIKSVLQLLTVLSIFTLSLYILMMVRCNDMQIKQKEEHTQEVHVGVIEKDIVTVGINNTKMEQNRSADMIKVNKIILIEEMEPEMIYSELQKRGYEIHMADSISRRDKAKLIYKFLKKAPKDTIDTFYEILKVRKRDFLLNILEASDQIFRYKKKDSLQSLLEQHFEDIVDRLLKDQSVDRIISILKGDPTLKKAVVAACEKLKNDEKKKISEMIKLAIEMSLESILQLVYALFIIDMYQTHRQTKDQFKQQEEDWNIIHKLVMQIISSQTKNITKDNSS